MKTILILLVIVAAGASAGRADDILPLRRSVTIKLLPQTAHVAPEKRSVPTVPAIHPVLNTAAIGGPTPALRHVGHNPAIIGGSIPVTPRPIAAVNGTEFKRKP